VEDACPRGVRLRATAAAAGSGDLLAPIPEHRGLWHGGGAASAAAAANSLAAGVWEAAAGVDASRGRACLFALETDASVAHDCSSRLRCAQRVRVWRRRRAAGLHPRRPRAAAVSAAQLARLCALLRAVARSRACARLCADARIGPARACTRDARAEGRAGAGPGVADATTELPAEPAPPRPPLCPAAPRSAGAPLPPRARLRVRARARARRAVGRSGAGAGVAGATHVRGGAARRGVARGLTGRRGPPLPGASGPASRRGGTGLLARPPSWAPAGARRGARGARGARRRRRRRRTRGSPAGPAEGRGGSPGGPRGPKPLSQLGGKLRGGGPRSWGAVGGGAGHASGRHPSPIRHRALAHGHCPAGRPARPRPGPDPATGATLPAGPAASPPARR
jgi:hypothetical protein